METAKEYSNGEVTIVWKSNLCTHPANCAKGLPQVFKPKERPWIHPDGANSNKIIEQVQKCPSGALTQYLNQENKHGKF